MDDALDTPRADAALPWLALLPALLQADSIAHGLALAAACLALGMLLLPSLMPIRRASSPTLRASLELLAVAAAAGVVQQAGLAADYARFAGLDLGLLLLAANVPLWRTPPGAGSLRGRSVVPMARILVASGLLAICGALREALGGAVPTRIVAIALLLAAAAALALRQAGSSRAERAA
jgi:hypothetical protein